MRSNRIIQSIMISAVAMLLLAACSIYDDYPHRRQYDVRLCVTDSTGQVLPDSVASVHTLYTFKNGIFFAQYMAEKDGVVRIAYEDTDSLTFVAMTTNPSNLCDITEPKIGESIHNVWLQMKTQGEGLAADLSEIYYGKLSTVIESWEPQEQQKTIMLRDQRAKARVYVRALRSKHGDGNYRVVLKGLRSGITYNGDTGGIPVNYNMEGKFVTYDDWETSAVNLLPTVYEPCRLQLFKQNGEMLIDTDVDENGKPLIIHPQDDIVFYVRVDTPIGITITVMPFEEFQNNYTFG